MTVALARSAVALSHVADPFLKLCRLTNQRTAAQRTYMQSKLPRHRSFLPLPAHCCNLGEQTFKSVCTCDNAGGKHSAPDIVGCITTIPIIEMRITAVSCGTAVCPGNPLLCRTANSLPPVRLPYRTHAEINHLRTSSKM